MIRNDNEELLKRKSKEELSIGIKEELFIDKQWFILSNNPSHPLVFSFGEDEYVGCEVQGDGLSEL